jgi:5,5'-dehydrodivanillate O-demethylase
MNGKWIPGGATVFPYMLGLPDGSFQISMPADDTHTYYIYYFTYDPADLKRELGLDWPAQNDPRDIPVFQVPVPKVEGGLDWPMLDNNSGQDLGILCSQGEIVERSRERLGQGDQGIVLYRQLLEEQIKIVEDGGEPMNTFRDPARNECINIPRGTGLLLYRNKDGPERTVAARKYSPIFRAALVKERGEAALDEPVH